MDAWGWCTGMTQRDDTGREEGSGWGTRVYLWRIHVDICQNQYNIVKLKNNIKKEILERVRRKFNPNTLLLVTQTGTTCMQNSLEIP